jgi:glycosyltransferase involved in cell wall biosynthesis
MRIAIMLQSIRHLGGIGMYTQHIVDEILALDRQREYILLYPTFGQSHKELRRYHAHDNVTEVLSKSLVPHGYYWDHVVVPRAVRKYGVDLLFNPFNSISLTGNFKKIFVVHGTEWFIMPEIFWWSARLTGRWRMMAMMKAADVVISVSHYAADEIVKATGVPREKFRVVHNAPAENFRPIQDEATLAAIKEKYRLPDDFILFVGGIYPSKNLKGLLEAFRLIAHDLPHTLVIAGNMRWKSAQDMRLIDDLGLTDRVQLLGWVGQADLPVLYNLATCFVIPSFHESCSVALLEALACGCPVIASQVCGNPEVVGDAAILVDPRSVTEIKDAILQVVNDADLRHQLSRQALLRAQQFNWQKSAMETLRIFDEFN